MEPVRVLIVEPVTLKDGQELKPWSYVWTIGQAQGDRVTIEHRNREYRIPGRCVAEVPVPPPSMEQLCAMDPCFAEVGKDFTEIYRDESRLFSVHRCRHGNHFLEDVRGGVGMFIIWIFLGSLSDQSTGSLEALWSQYHKMPHDAIFYLGLGCA